MNKDEIQRDAKGWKPLKSCGLVMNKDEIQHFLPIHHELCSCGLVMNKDEIQHICKRTRSRLVVVW